MEFECNRSPQSRASTAFASLVQQVPSPPFNFHSREPGTPLHEIGIDDYGSSQSAHSEQPPNSSTLLLRCPTLKNCFFATFSDRYGNREMRAPKPGATKIYDAFYQFFA